MFVLISTSSFHTAAYYYSFPIAIIQHFLNQTEKLKATKNINDKNWELTWKGGLSSVCSASGWSCLKCMNQCKLLPASVSKWTDEQGVEWDSKNVIILLGMWDSVDVLSTLQVNYLVGLLASEMAVWIWLMSGSLSILSSPPSFPPHCDHMIQNFCCCCCCCIPSDISPSWCFGFLLKVSTCCGFPSCQIKDIIHKTNASFSQFSQNITFVSMHYLSPEESEWNTQYKRVWLFTNICLQENHTTQYSLYAGRGMNIKQWSMKESSILWKSLYKYIKTNSHTQASSSKINVNKATKKARDQFPRGNKSWEMWSSCNPQWSQEFDHIFSQRWLKHLSEKNRTAVKSKHSNKCTYFEIPSSTMSSHAQFSQPSELAQYAACEHTETSLLCSAVISQALSLLKQEWVCSVLGWKIHLVLQEAVRFIQ